jgi:hypothetical protein
MLLKGVMEKQAEVHRVQASLTDAVFNNPPTNPAGYYVRPSPTGLQMVVAAAGWREESGEEFDQDTMHRV